MFKGNERKGVGNRGIIYIITKFEIHNYRPTHDMHVSNTDVSIS